MTVVVTVLFEADEIAAFSTVRWADGIKRRIRSEADLLTDRELGALKPKEKALKASGDNELTQTIIRELLAIEERRKAGDRYLGAPEEHRS